MESEIIDYAVKGLAVLATLNVAGFVSSLENIKTHGADKYCIISVDRAIEFVTKPGRTLAYLISKK